MLSGHVTSFALTQYPNYLQLLYLLLLPLGMLPLEAARFLWTGCNLVFLVTAVLLLARGARMSRRRTVLVLGLLLAGQPAITAIVNGQQTALALVTAVVACAAWRERVAGPALAVVLVRYSFAPVLLVLAFRRRWRVLAACVTVEVAGLVAGGLLTGTSPWRMLVGPLLVSRPMGPGAGDLTTVMKQWYPSHDNVVAYAVAVATCAALAWACRRVLAHGHWVDALAVASLISLACLPHLVYDYCFLLPVLVSAQFREGWAKWVLHLVVLVPWLSWLVGIEVLDPRHVANQIGTLLVLLGCLTVVVRTAAVSRARPAVEASGPLRPMSIEASPEATSTRQDARTSRR